MARIRTIKPEFFTAEQIADCSPTARYLFIGMWCFCDDQGIHPASLKQIKMEIFPADDLQIDMIKNLINEIISADLMIEYEVGGKRYWQVTGWKHQKIDKPNKKHPLPEESKIIRRLLADHLPEESKGREGSLEESKGKKKDTPLPLKIGVGGAQLKLIDSEIALEGFDECWELWPRKEAKKLAQKRWLTARKKASITEIKAGVIHCKLEYDSDERKESEKRGFVPHFATWLHNERWRDYADSPEPEDTSNLSNAENTRRILLEAGLTPLL